MNPRALISEALGQRKDAVFFRMSEMLAEAFPERAVAETEDGNFKLLNFAWAQQCTAKLKASVHSQMEAQHNPARHSLWESPTNAWHAKIAMFDGSNSWRSSRPYAA